MKPMTKPPNYDTDPIAEICAGQSATMEMGPRRHDGNAYGMNPKARERRVDDARKAKRKGKQMTPEKMRQLQTQVDDFKRENDALNADLERVGDMLDKSEKALYRRGMDLKKARAKIKTLEG